VFILLSRGHFEQGPGMKQDASDAQAESTEAEAAAGERLGFWDQLLHAFTMSYADPFTPMISLTRLNGQAFVINAEKIRYVEQTPDTMICCDNGEKMIVRESLQEVMRRAIEYARIIRKAITE
jgi:flagellar protein FlbD